jgi:molybdopterin-guanine dinucleotide biosynthesis protein A
VARDNAFGYVLAGGRSRRMGRDKALLRVRGETLVERALGTMRHVVSDVAIVGDRPDLAHFAEIVPDAASGVGPVAGLVAGTGHCMREWALFMPVDVPQMSAETLTQMLDAARETDALGLVPLADGVPQPLCVVLHRTLHDALARQMLSGERKVLRALEGAAGARLIFMPVRGLDQFANLNTPEDVAEYDGEEALPS